nr:RNA-directed DNA polymerase, eukaryota [Tanacetum cinerariifolium]
MPISRPFLLALAIQVPYSVESDIASLTTEAKERSKIWPPEILAQEQAESGFHFKLASWTEPTFLIGYNYQESIKIDSSLTLSHFFYADDVVFIGEWSNGGNMSLVKEWDESIAKLKKKLSKWKVKTLSVGGRLTLLKTMLGSTHIYNMSLFKVPKHVLNSMERMHMNFFNGVQEGERKIDWVKWSKVLASNKFGGLGVSSFFALNRALIFKWVWRFLSHDNSLWFRVIFALHGSNLVAFFTSYSLIWSTIIKEVNSLKAQ